MYQFGLFEKNNETQSVYKTVSVDAVEADFASDDAKNYDVMLSINSNKFQIQMEKCNNRIEAFEVVAMKGFFELNRGGIGMLKSLVQHLDAKE